MMTINKHQLYKKQTEDFISESLKKEDPAGLCFSTSFPLLIYLATKQIKSRLRTGRFPKKMPDDQIKEVDHYWLQMDNEGTILDSTIQQFNKDAEPIYIGKLIDCEVTSKYKLCDLPSSMWFPESYNSWKTPYVDLTYPLDGAFVKRSIIYTLKLGTILHAEIKKMSFACNFINRHSELYFIPIYIFLHNWQMKKIQFEIDKDKLPNGFDILLSDALKWAKDRQLR